MTDGQPAGVVTKPMNGGPAATRGTQTAEVDTSERERHERIGRGPPVTPVPIATDVAGANILGVGACSGLRTDARERRGGDGSSEGGSRYRDGANRWRR